MEEGERYLDLLRRGGLQENREKAGACRRLLPQNATREGQRGSFGKLGTVGDEGDM